jgi:hypothetical protein
MWYHYARLIDDDKLVGSGLLNNLDLTENGTNQVGVVFVGDIGWLFINNSLVTDLDLSNVTGAGDIRAVTGVFGETDMRSDFATNFGAFQIVQPSLILKNPSGALVRDGNFITELGSSKELVNSYSTVTMRNPYGPPRPWSYGFEFRNGEGMGYIFFNSMPGAGLNWELKYRWDSLVPSSGSRITSGKASNLKLNSEDSNKLGLMVIDDVGVLYLNDQKVSELNLTSITGSGTNGIAAGFYSSEDWEPVGTRTEFEGFNVWSLGE